MIEIERRFLCRITDLDALRRAARESSIRQGYLTDRDPAVRIRERDGAWILTIKSGMGRVRREIEIPIDPDAGAALMEMAGDRRLDKLRLVAGRWEIDRFRGKLDGLVLAEVELTRADEPIPPAPAGIELLREVTEDPAFTNQQLAALPPDDAVRFVRAVRAG